MVHFRPMYLMYFVIIVIIFTFIGLRLRIDHTERLFKSYMKNFSKTYSDSEYEMRLGNFKASLFEITRLNSQSGPALYGFTKYSDMSSEEFKSTMLMSQVFEKKCENYTAIGCHETSKAKQIKKLKLHFSEVFETENGLSEGNKTKFGYRVRDGRDIPMKHDWRSVKDAIGPVLDQGSCRSCWAFSVVGVMETRLVLEGISYYHRLSVQELTDCSTFTRKCEGGNVAWAMKYLCNNDLPITYEEEYPLTLVDEQCRYRPRSGVLLDSFTVRCDVSALEIAKLVYTEGPVTAAVNADNWAHYLGGIIQYHCSGEFYDELRHVVQIVGYDLTTTPPHFIVKNSWGPDFGIDGYMNIAMGAFVCGVGRQIGYLNVFEV